MKLEHGLNKAWYLLNELVKVHGWAPLILITLDFIVILIKRLALVYQSVDLTISSLLATSLWYNVIQ